MKKFAVFDIDGTLIRWQLYHATADAMFKHGIIAPQQYEKVREARMFWKKRGGTDAFREYEATLVKALETAMQGYDVESFDKLADIVVEEYKDQVYTYTRDLIQTLKSQGYLLFAVSGSPEVIVRKLAEHYKFDDFAATTYVAEDGRYRGVQKLALGNKPELLQALVEKHGATTAGSIGIGDTESDISMLELVKQPIAFNPSKKMFQHAEVQGWKIVLERKNMIYELEQKNGSYLLATSDA